MSHSDELPQVTSTPEPVMALEYGRPTPRTGQARDTALGVVSAILFALGAGAVTFGVMVASNTREAVATTVAAGVSAITLSLGLMGTILWLRISKH